MRATALPKAILSVFLIAIVFTSATAKTPAMRVADPGELDAVTLDRTPSLAVQQPMQNVAWYRTPSLAMDTGPVIVDPDRKSIIWQAFPEPLQVEIYERYPVTDFGFYPFDDGRKTPSLQVMQPMQTEPIDAIRRTPSLAMDNGPVIVDPVRKTPSLQVMQPMQTEPIDAIRRHPVIDCCFYLFDDGRKTPSLQVMQPMQTEPIDAVRRTPSLAVREPLDVSANGPTLSFNLKQASGLEIAIYSVTGRHIRTISESSLPSGTHSITWDGKDGNGCRAASGVYFARVQAGQDTGKGKLVLVR